MTTGWRKSEVGKINDKIFNKKSSDELGNNDVDNEFFDFLKEFADNNLNPFIKSFSNVVIFSIKYFVATSGDWCAKS